MAFAISAQFLSLTSPSDPGRAPGHGSGAPFFSLLKSCVGLCDRRGRDGVCFRQSLASGPCHTFGGWAGGGMEGGAE